MRGATMTSDRVNVVLAQVEGFRQRLHDIQREMDPLMDQYENLKSIHNKDDERLHDALAMIWNAWWDISDTVGYLRAAQRRLRDGDGITADAK